MLVAASLVLWFITVRFKIRAYIISKFTGDDILSTQNNPLHCLFPKFGNNNTASKKNSILTFIVHEVLFCD